MAISFLADGAPVFTIARTLLLLVCRDDNIVQESLERIRDVYLFKHSKHSKHLFKLLNIFQSLTIEAFLNHSCVIYDISVQTFMFNIKTKYIGKRWSYLLITFHRDFFLLMVNQPILDTLELLCERECSTGEDNDTNNQMSMVYFYLFGIETIPLDHCCTGDVG